MNIKWEKYNIKSHVSLDEWNLMNSKIDRFAMFGESLSKQANWYKNNPDDPISNYKDYIYVIKKDIEFVGYIICNVSYLGKYYQAGINPIVINPKFINKGFGKLIINEFIKNNKILLGVNVKEYLVMVHEKNDEAYKLFTSVGFRETTNGDGFIELMYNV